MIRTDRSTSNSPARKRVLSGMRPTGRLHLGNYMGALYNWVGLQEDYDCYFFIADWHALTTDYADPSRIKQNSLDVALDWLAAGLDPQRSTIFIQSHVPQHAELHLLLSMITPLGWLERVPTYKEQMENIRGKDLTTYGFLGYPLLQSADILIYQADFVPVGQDQVAHVELTREVARRFNSMYKTTVFPEPGVLLTPVPKLPGTDGRKMSKSYGNTIGLTDAPAVVASKIHHMSTNGQRIRQTDPGDPDRCPVGDLHKVFSSKEVIAETQTGCRTAAIRCEFCKIEAGRSVGKVTGPIYEKRLEYESRIEETWDILLSGAENAARRAEETLAQVRTVLNVTRDLGPLNRRYGMSNAAREELYDLSKHSDWWNLAFDLQAKQLREYWRNNLVRDDIPLTQESNRVFATIERELEEPLLTAGKKRIFVTAASEGDKGWEFQIPPKSYEIWTFLCWLKDFRLQDFVVPQGVYSQAFLRAKNLLGKGAKIPVRISEHSGEWSLHFDQLSEEIDITPYLHDYGPLQPGKIRT